MSLEHVERDDLSYDRKSKRAEEYAPYDEAKDRTTAVDDFMELAKDATVKPEPHIPTLSLIHI